MTLKKSLSFLLALTLVLSLLAPCGALIPVSAATTLYGNNLEQVTEPVIGESYYLGADVNGTMMYFRHGTISDTVPYSLVTTDNINHNWCFKLTLEDSINTNEKFEGGFQLCYTNPSNGKLSRIYCMDSLLDKTVAGQTGIMDTGANTSAPYKNRHSFYVDENNLLHKYGNDNIMVVMQVPQTVKAEDGTESTANVWRMLGVPVKELANEGVYPVMLLQEHTHTLGDAVADAAANTVSRSCDCGYVETVYDCKVSSVDKAVVGESYYLTANVNGTPYYFRHGTVTDTSPVSLVATTNFAHNWTFPVTLEAPVEGNTGFQMTYANPSKDGTLRIYCYDSVGSDEVMDTGANSSNEFAKHTFFVDEIDGVKVIRKAGSTHVLVLKQVPQTVKAEDGTESTANVWRILGVDESELANEGVYPVVLTQKHEHEAATTSYVISDSGHSPLCWCGEPAAEVAHTLGEVTHNADNTHTRVCTVCGYENVIYGEKYEQVNTPTVGETYALAANVNGQLLSFYHSGGYTGTTPQSISTTDTLYAYTLETALESGKGEFQLVNEAGYYVYSIAAGPGMTTSSGYITKPERVSFLMDQVNGQTVIRAYGTQNILAAKYSDAKSAWRIFAVEESELEKEGVYPVVLLGEHEHTYGAWSELSQDYTQTRACTLCGHVETMWGAQDKAVVVEEPVIGESYYLVANVDGKLFYFRHGTATDTAPYSLVVTSDFNHNWVLPLTVEDPTATNEKITTGFQLTYTHPSNGNLTRIYCYDVLKDTEDVPGQTGVMDTGLNTVCYKNRHNFTIQQINGQYLLHKTGNDNVLVVKYNSDKGDYRMLGVPQSELGNEGVYPVMLANVHTHVFGEELHSSGVGHWHVCDCGIKSAVESHDFGNWTLDAENKTQSATCTDCGYALQEVQSPYFDVVESMNELELGEIAYDEAAGVYSVTGGEEYYLMTEVDGVNYYFRQTTKTAGGNSETVTSTTANSLYSTSDPNHKTLGLVKVVAGNTEGSYILTATTDATRVIYVNDEGKDDDIDVGITAFKGASDNATYIARAEAQWDAENGYFYHMEDKVKYVLVLKQLEATYTVKDADTGETVVVEGPAKEWRITAVPEAEAIPESGCYIMKLAQHVHNYPTAFETDNVGHWKSCPCGHKDYAEHTVEEWTIVASPSETATGSKTGECTVCGTTVTVETPITVEKWNIVLSDNVGVNFNLALTKGDAVEVMVDGQLAKSVVSEKGDGIYNVFIELAAAQMADEITIVVNGHALEKTYSVRAYADAILNGEYTSYTKELVKNMLVYGGAAQSYFAHNEENLAGADIAVTPAVPGEAPEVTIVKELTDVLFYGASLLHEEKTAVRFYFAAESIEGLTFQVNGNVYEPVSKNGLYYIQVSGINPQELADVLNVVVTDGTASLAVQYSPLVYIARMYNKADASDELKALVQAMYGYHLSAKTYLANLNLDDNFAVQSEKKSTLHKGVELHEKVYVAAGYGQVKAYALVVDADADVELKVSAGAWSEENTAENPAEVKTVGKHFKAVQNADYEVLGMINGGFFDLNTTKTMKPYGMQIVDGVVKQAPVAGGAYSDNWFGMTKDGKYVISDAAGYAEYEGNVQQAVGGGKVLIKDGVPVDLTSGRDYRTAVGVNADGDLVMVAVKDATYSDVCHIFVDMGMDIVTVLNLDGGGSTAMYVPGTFFPMAKILGSYREVADAVAIVVK